MMMFPVKFISRLENEGNGSSERIPVEIIPIPSQAVSFAGKNHLPLPIPTKLDLVEMEIQQYKIKAQLARILRNSKKLGECKQSTLKKIWME